MGKDILAEYLGKLFDAIGIHPIDGVAIIFIILSISYRKDIKRWGQLAVWQQVIIISTGLGTIMFSIMSLLRLLGLTNL